MDADAGTSYINGEFHPFDPHFNQDAVLDHDDLLLIEEIPNAHDNLIGGGELKMLFENEITLLVRLSLDTGRLLTSLVFNFHIVSKKR